MQRLLRHCPYEGHERSLEALTKYAFPSNATRTFSSLLLDSLSARIGTDVALNLKLAQVVVTIWDQCLKERVYSPVYLLLDLLRFALRLQPASTIIQLIPTAVPLCIRTIDVGACPVIWASKQQGYASSTEYKNFLANVIPYIDVDEVLDMLRTFCDAAGLDTEILDQFWRSIEFSAVFMMLHKALPISQIIAALELLKTAVFTNFFGPIHPTPDTGENTAEQQAKQERELIERLTQLLFEMPELPSDEPPYTDAEIAELRIEILEVLKALCATEHGGLLLAQHRTVIGRLVRFLDGQVCRLYNTRPSIGLDLSESTEPIIAKDSGDQPLTNEGISTHDLIARTINITTRMLYHLLRTHEPHIDLQQKLAAVKGGYHKFLASMTRIAFSEQLVLEHGIEEAAVEAAHCILDNVLSPEEGEAIMKAVETPRGTKGSAKSWETTEKDTSQEDGGVDEEMDVG